MGSPDLQSNVLIIMLLPLYMNKLKRGVGFWLWGSVDACVFLQSHAGLIVNFFKVNTFAIRHFTVSLLHFEFCPEESGENFF